MEVMVRKLNSTCLLCVGRACVRAVLKRSSLLTCGRLDGLPINLVQGLEDELESLLASLKWLDANLNLVNVLHYTIGLLARLYWIKGVAKSSLFLVATSEKPPLVRNVGVSVKLPLSEPCPEGYVRYTRLTLWSCRGCTRYCLLLLSCKDV